MLVGWNALRYFEVQETGSPRVRLLIVWEAVALRPIRKLDRESGLSRLPDG